MADDYSADASTTGQLSVGSSVTGTFEVENDRDWFKVHLVAGQTYQFVLAGAAAGKGSLTSDDYHWATLSIYDANSVFQMSQSGGAAGGLPSLPFTATATADYFVSVRSYYDTGTYTLSVTQAAMDDVGDRPATAKDLPANGIFDGSIGLINDRDFFRVHLDAGQLYTATLNDRNGQGGLLDTAIFDANGQYVELAQDTLAGGNSYSVSGVPAVSGDYYIQVMSWLGTGDYRLQFGRASDDYLASTATKGRLLPGASVSGTMETLNDRDWFALHLAADSNLRLDLASRGTSPSGQNWHLRLYDAQGQLLKDSFDSGSAQSLSAGDYYVEVSSDKPDTYQLTAAAVQDDFDYGLQTTARLTPGKTQAGHLDFKGDGDSFRLAVQTGHVYTVSWSLASGMDASGIYFDVNDNLINYGLNRLPGSSDGYGATTLQFKARTDGDVILGLSSYSVTGAYSVTVTEGPVDDVGDDEAHAHVLTAGTDFTGQLDAFRDTDAFRVHLQAGVTYLFHADGLSHLDMGTNPNVNFSARDFYMTPTTATDVVLYLSDNIENGNYRLQVKLSEDDFAGNASTTGKMQLGGSVNGKLENGGDQDWIAVDLSANTNYWAQLTSSVHVPEPLRLVDASGSVLAQVSADQTLSFTPAQSGRYYLSVGGGGDYASYVDSQSAPTTYTLSLRTGADDHPGVTALTLDQTMSGVLETISDTDVFSAALKAGHFYSTSLEAKDSFSDYFPSGLVLLNGASYVTNNLFQANADATMQFTVSTIASQAPLDYRLLLRDLGADDFPAPSRALQIGGSVAGNLEAKIDTDTFLLDLKQGQQLRFTAQAGAGEGPTLPWNTKLITFLHLTHDGAPVSSDGSLLFDDTLTWTVPSDGTYAATIGGPDVSGSYRLSLADLSLHPAPPRLVSTSISSALHPQLTLTLDKPVVRASGSALIKNGSNVYAKVDISDSTHASLDGNKLTLKLDSTLLPGGTYELVLPEGYVTDTTGNKLAAVSSYYLSVPEGAYSAGNGNDVYLGHSSGYFTDGGPGLDTMVFFGALTDYVVERTDYGFSVGWNSTQRDYLKDIERVAFTGSTDALALDVSGPNGVAGEIYRLYQAAFDRVPDKVGIGYWMAMMDQGTSLHDVAAGFVGSKEFTALFGSNPSDADFVTSMYQHVLHRAPEPDGNSYWLGMLHNGMSRVDVLTAFSESPENQAAVAKIIGTGFVYTPYGG